MNIFSTWLYFLISIFLENSLFFIKTHKTGRFHPKLSREIASTHITSSIHAEKIYSSRARQKGRPWWDSGYVSRASLHGPKIGPFSCQICHFRVFSRVLGKSKEPSPHFLTPGAKKRGMSRQHAPREGLARTTQGHAVAPPPVAISWMAGRKRSSRSSNTRGTRSAKAARSGSMTWRICG